VFLCFCVSADLQICKGIPPSPALPKTKRCVKCALREKIEIGWALVWGRVCRIIQSYGHLEHRVSCAMPFHSLPLRLQTLAVPGNKLHVKAEVVGGSDRQPIVLILVLDNSGSMGESAGGGGEGAAYTRLDLVKHASRVMAAMLHEEDTLIVVRFSTDARTILAPTPMNAAGQASLHSVLETVWPDSSTNLFAGIQEAAKWASSAAFADAHIACMVLTDGFPTVEPPRGTLQMLQNGTVRVANPWTLHTFGFGYSLDSKLLADIADWGGGLFGFIPDCSMVGTVFINALAHILCTGNLGTTLRVSGTGMAPLTLATGPLALGQPRDFLFVLPSGVAPPCARCTGRTEALLGSLEPRGGVTDLDVVCDGPTDSGVEDPVFDEPICTAIAGAGAGAGAAAGAACASDASIGADSAASAFAIAHADYLQVLGQVLVFCKSGMAGVAEAERLLADFIGRHADCNDLRIKALLRDVRSITEGEGQVGMAPAHFWRWGEHYLRAYKRAQELQQCMNFKDPGLQIYGGTLFHHLQEDGDRLFCTLPAPRPTGAYAGTGAGAGAGAVASMAVFHNPSGGCFAPSTLIRMTNGKDVPIYDISPGDLVATPSGPATVIALVTCNSAKRSQPMSKIGDLLITPWHPVGIHGLWRFPADIGGYNDRLMPTVYNLVLNSGHIVYASGFEACTLGHGFTEAVVAHPFFGTERVIEDLRKVAGWDVGRPTFQNLVAIRDADTDMICGWMDMAAV
jgi:hypothetical protein